MDHHHHDPAHASPAQSNLAVATSATLHCLTGCGIGEVIGDSIGTGFHFANLPTILLGIGLGAVLGFGLGLGPWRKQGLSWGDAARRVLVAEGLSIVVMEAAEVLVETMVPGLMNASLLQPFYWAGMVGALAAGFVAAWPVNYVLAKRGVSHAHH